MHSSGSLDVPQQVRQKTRLLLLHLQRAGAWPAGPLSSVEADEINLNFTVLSGESFNIKNEADLHALPIRSLSPWPLVLADKAAKGLGLQPRGLGG